MMCLIQVLLVLGCITLIQTLLLKPCGEGCFIRIQPLSNLLHCDCSGKTVLKEVNNHHHHLHHEHDYPDATHASPTTVNSRIVQSGTTSLCDDGCYLNLYPWHFCVCNPPSVTSTLQPDPTTSQSVQDTTTADTMTTTEAQTATLSTQTKMTETPSRHLLQSTDIQDESSTTETATTHVPTTLSTKSPTTLLLTKLTTQKPITQAPKTVARTQSICDILCAQQLGGDACHCSKPGLPG